MEAARRRRVHLAGTAAEKRLPAIPPRNDGDAGDAGRGLAAAAIGARRQALASNERRQGCLPNIQDVSGLRIVVDPVIEQEGMTLRDR